ncbi:hypothetical protein [Roseimicrobium gellanilyticum]|nr:hypothetical protein [Roseimicrobium gellanilyticum]
MFTALLCTVVLAFGAGVLGFVFFDRLLRVCFLQHRSEWELCGRPIGFFWVPRDVKVERAGMARTTVFANWLFRVPAWLREDGEALLAYNKFRRINALSSLLAVVVIAELIALVVLVFFGVKE